MTFVVLIVALAGAALLLAASVVLLAPLIGSGWALALVGGLLLLLALILALVVRARLRAAAERRRADAVTLAMAEGLISLLASEKTRKPVIGVGLAALTIFLLLGRDEES
jgi:hypothetical protein